MKREQLMFLLGGLAFGILIGFGSYHAIHSLPSLDGSAAIPAGAAPPPAPAPMNNPNAAGGAPMFKRVNELKRLLQEDPENVQILRELANLHYDAAMWQQAVDYYERIAKLEPNPNVLTDLGASYRGVGKFDRALDAFARARAMDPSHWQSLYNIIVVAVSDIGRADIAREALDAMEAIEPRPGELTDSQLQQLRHAVEAMANRAEQPS